MSLATPSTDRVAAPRLPGALAALSTPATRLVLISFVSLYAELTFIRWAPMQVRLLAYFSNYVLIAALLGLGLGMMLTQVPRRLVLWFPPALLLLTIVVYILERSSFYIPIVSEGQFIWNYLAQLPAAGVVAYLILVAFFLAVVGTFVTIGQEVGLALRGFKPLPAYSLNIFGSLLGVIGFAALSFTEAPPQVWFAISGILVVGYLAMSGVPIRRVVIGAAWLVAAVVVVGADSFDVPAGTQRVWSPYYEIETMALAGQPGFDLIVNKDSHQQALDLSNAETSDYVASRQRLYDLPYRFGDPARVLVVGAGTGNDVAAALRQAPSSSVDAVEIDPTIARLGAQHPEHPYDAAQVNVVVDDARSFLQRDDSPYDLIVFGFLDSHRLFSHMSSVRMDNYVYTRENFERVRERLSPNGVVAVTFTIHEQWIADRIFTVMSEVFGAAPVVYQGDRYSTGTVFLAGPSGLSVPAGEEVLSADVARSQLIEPRDRITWLYNTTEGFVDPALFSSSSELLTDDWPFLYMHSRSVPPNYLLALFLTFGASVALVWVSPVPRIDLRSMGNWNFFFLGAAFALLETRGITEVALVFGSTWLTNTIVIGSILFMILIANLITSRWRPPLLAVYAALVAALLLDYFVQLQLALSLDFWLQVAIAGIRVSLPILFSGIVFARWFERAERPAAALGANLLGAVLGGLLEYLSLIVGLRQLYLLAIGFYLLSAATTLREPREAQLRASIAAS